MKLVWITLLATALPAVMGNPVASEPDDVANEARGEANVAKYADYPRPKGGYGKYADYGKYPPKKEGYGKYANYGKYRGAGKRDEDEEQE